MGLDSTANLLFKIGGDSSEGQASVQQFRNMLTGDLAAMRVAFGDWAKNIVGELGSANAALLGIGAVAAAAGVAIVVSLDSAAKKAEAFALQIEDGMSKTGLGAEEMSKLRFAAERAGVEYNSLVTSIVRFERATVEASAGGKQYADAFRRLGINQAEVKQGTENILPLLLRTADAFKSQSSVTEKAAMAQDLFSRSGADLLTFLSLGSAGIQRFMDRAGELGRIVDEATVKAAYANRIARQELTAMREAIELSVGAAALPWETKKASVWIAFLEQAKGLLKNTPWDWEFWVRVGAESKKAENRIVAAALATQAASGLDRLLPPESAAGGPAKKSLKSFEGLSNILAQVRGRLASFGSEEEQLAFSTAQLADQVLRAQEELIRVKAAGELAGESLRRESQALAALEAALPALAEAQAKELAAKRAKAEEEAAEAAAKRRAELEAVEEARKEAFAQELTDLQQHLANIITARMTSQERLSWQYEQDLVAFSAVEEARSLATKRGEAERQAIREQYEINRQAALGAYETGLTQLANSTGWRAVFGEEFADRIRGNEELLREWSESANQSLMLVRVAIASMEEALQRAFVGFSRAMAQNISQAFIYKQSIGEAMRAAAASALQAIAAESIVQAIYSSAIGFLRLALHDYPGAAAAFKAAALFGSVGAVAAVAGRAIAPQQAGAGAAAGGSGGSSGAGGGAASYGGSNEREGPRVVIYVQGSVVGTSGIEELTDMINEAVQGRDVRLVATQVKQLTRAIT